MRAQLTDQIQPAHARQPEIDHRQVVVELLGLIQRIDGVGHGLDHMAAVRQAGLQVMTQQRFILDNQQFHVALPGKSNTPEARSTHLHD
ncbi:hypothetical protein D3C76_755800 [compost metagenome]